MGAGSAGGDDVRHSSVMLELGKCMNITMAGEWNFLGNGIFLEGEGRGLGKKKKGRQEGEGRPRPESTAGRQAPRLTWSWESDLKTVRRAAGGHGGGGWPSWREAQLNGHCWPRTPDAPMEKHSQEGERESAEKRKCTAWWLTQTPQGQMGGLPGAGRARPLHTARLGSDDTAMASVSPSFLLQLPAAGLTEEVALGPTLGSPAFHVGSLLGHRGRGPEEHGDVSWHRPQAPVGAEGQLPHPKPGTSPVPSFHPNGFPQGEPSTY